MIETNSNEYTYVFDVKQHDWTDLTYVVLITFFKRSLLMGGGKNNPTPGISWLLDKTETKFQRLTSIFDDGLSNKTNGETVQCDRKWKIQDGGL